MSKTVITKLTNFSVYDISSRLLCWTTWLVEDVKVLCCCVHPAIKTQQFTSVRLWVI